MITLNEYRREKPGSVGTPLDGVEVRIGEGGEILTRGPHVMLGYYKDEAATLQARDPDGWLHTGDLGRMDADGWSPLPAAAKRYLVLSNGKNVACAAVEHALDRSPYIQQALVVGDGRKFVSVLLVPHLDNLARAARERGLTFDHPEELLLMPPMVALFREELNAYQAEFSSFEQAKRFCFLKEEALLDTELVTPTLESPPRGARAQVCGLDRTDVPARGSPVIPALAHDALRQDIETGTYKTS